MPSTINPHRFNPYKNFKFRIKWNGRIVGAAHEISGIYVTEVSKSKFNKTKQPGLTKYSNVTIKRGFTNDIEFMNWLTEIKSSASRHSSGINDFRREIIIEDVDEAGSTVVAYLLTGAFPSKVNAPNLNAKGNEVTIESIELEHEGLEITRC